MTSAVVPLFPEMSAILRPLKLAGAEVLQIVLIEGPRRRGTGHSAAVETCAPGCGMRRDPASSPRCRPFRGWNEVGIAAREAASGEESAALASGVARGLQVDHLGQLVAQRKRAGDRARSQYRREVP